MIDRGRLLAAVTPAADDVRPKRVPLPTLGEALYEPASREPKRCGNCYKFIATGACVEVRGDIDAGQVCGMHVEGAPQSYMPAVGKPARQLDAADAGLVWTPEGVGTACESCRFFTPDEPAADIGICDALGAEGTGLPPVSVQALGCCARWQHRTEDDATDFRITPFGEPPTEGAIEIE